jgi:3-oxoacyl-[acyl-carrier protein] reductase
VDLGISGRVALVTGGSAGLGLAVARALAAEGARIALNARDPARLGAAVASLRDATGAEVRGFAGDVGAPGGAGAVVAETVRAFGQLDVLLANAGGPPRGSWDAHDAAAWRSALEYNLLSTVDLCRAAVPGMVARRWGRVLAITSFAARQPVPGLILSTTARAGVLGFLKALADEVAHAGVTVNALCPGHILTDRQRHLAGEAGDLEAALAARAAEIPARRIGTPAELGDVACFLASERASYVTGTAIAVDGGLTRAIG